MRLIDAEALLELFDKECARECDNCVYYEKCIGHQYCGLIDKAPTIEERPKGKWLPKGRWHIDPQCIEYTCSICGRRIMIEERLNVIEQYPFCHCGARMEDEE